MFKWLKAMLWNPIKSFFTRRTPPKTIESLEFQLKQANRKIEELSTLSDAYQSSCAEITKMYHRDTERFLDTRAENTELKQQLTWFKANMWFKLEEGVKQVKGNGPTPSPRPIENSKILMFDHGGVLDGEMTAQTPTDNDLVLDDLGDGVKSILRNGVAIIQQLNEMVDKQGYKIVFHSKNRELDQVRIMEQLQKACRAKQIPFPTITAMAVYDSRKYAGVLPSAPKIEANKPHGVMVIGYGVEGEGKSCVRQALVTALNVPKEKYGNCIVFDDGASVISQAFKEGYQAYCIGMQANTMPLFRAIEDIYERAKASVFGLSL